MCIYFDRAVAFWGLCFRETKALGPKTILPDCLLQHFSCWQNNWEPSDCLSGSNSWMRYGPCTLHNILQLSEKPESAAFLLICRDVHDVLWGTPAAGSYKELRLINQTNKTPPVYVCECSYEQRESVEEHTSHLMLILCVLERFGKVGGRDH